MTAMRNLQGAARTPRRVHLAEESWPCSWWTAMNTLRRCLQRAHADDGEDIETRPAVAAVRPAVQDFNPRPAGRGQAGAQTLIDLGQSRH